MGLLSTLGKIGQVAASFIPGVGPAISNAIGTGTDIAGQIVGNKASNKATKAQTDAIDRERGILTRSGSDAEGILRGGQQQSYEAQLGVLDRTTAANQPYVDVGQQGLLGLSDMASSGRLRTPEFNPKADLDAGSEALIQDALKALTRTTAGRSRLNSGGTIREIEDLAQTLSNKYRGDIFGRSLDTYNANRAGVEDEYKRLMGLSDIGERGTARIGAADSNFGNQTQGLNERTATSIADSRLGTGRLLAGLEADQGNVEASGYGTRAALLNTTLSNVGQDVGELIGLRQARQKKSGVYAAPQV